MSKFKKIAGKVVDATAGATFGATHLVSTAVSHLSIGGEHLMKKTLTDRDISLMDTAVDRSEKTRERLLRAEKKALDVAKKTAYYQKQLEEMLPTVKVEKPKKWRSNNANVSNYQI